MAEFRCKFELQTRVTIDGDNGLRGVVTAVCFWGDYATYEISWIVNGDSKVAWIEEWRLRNFDED